MAAYYPEKPSQEKKAAVTSFYKSFSLLYPCNYCAEELRADLIQNQIKAESREELMKWTCDMHNRVNTRLGKDTFNCDIDFLGKLKKSVLK
jgi:FAD-linked sulfhydryl oxidase